MVLIDRVVGLDAVHIIEGWPACLSVYRRLAICFVEHGDAVVHMHGVQRPCPVVDFETRFLGVKCM